MPQYQFVAVESRDGKASKLTRSIRSHAIRAGLQKRTYSSRGKAAGRSLRSTKSRKESMFHFEFHGGVKTLQDRFGSSFQSAESTTPEFRSKNTQSVPRIFTEGPTTPPTYRIESVCTGRVDPFNSLPIRANLEVDYLVKYFLTRFDLNLTPVDRRSSWFLYALQSAPMMHSTLAMTAALWRAEHPALEYSIQLEGIHQKGEAMREIRARLAYGGSIGNDDEISFLMSTMSTLVIVEVYDSDFVAAETHLRGVYNLFSSRGCRDSFKSEFILCKSINLADFQVAAAMGHQLIFPLLHTDQAYLPLSILEQAQYPPLDHSISVYSPHDHVQIFTKLRQLLLARQSSLVLPEALRIMLNVVDHSILHYLYQDHIEISDASGCSRALVLAAHVFMYVILRQVPPKCPLVRRICVRLQNTLALTPATRETWIENRAALLWIAFVGLLGMGEEAGTCPEGKWFLSLFQSTMHGYLQDFPLSNDSARTILSTFLWDELYCQPALARLEDFSSTYVH